MFPCAELTQPYSVYKSGSFIRADPDPETPAVRFCASFINNATVPFETDSFLDSQFLLYIATHETVVAIENSCHTALYRENALLAPFTDPNGASPPEFERVNTNPKPLTRKIKSTSPHIRKCRRNSHMNAKNYMVQYFLPGIVGRKPKG